MAQPDEIAKLIYYLSSSENTYITNEVISISHKNMKHDESQVYLLNKVADYVKTVEKRD